MRSFLKSIDAEINLLISDLNKTGDNRAKVIARTLAAIELKLQAARSLFEARLMEADADNFEREDKLAKFVKTSLEENEEP